MQAILVQCLTDWTTADRSSPAMPSDSDPESCMQYLSREVPTSPHCMAQLNPRSLRHKEGMHPDCSLVVK